jgi:hypothetical protein
MVAAAKRACSSVSMAALELDHVFVAVPEKAPQVSVLTSCGFEEGNRHPHSGQGTASTGVFFENAYLELIWLEDSDAAGSPSVRRTHLYERVDLGHEASPFGFGLRKARKGSQPLPFSTWDYRPPYLPEGASIAMGVNSECLGEPLLFALPWKSGPGYECPDHPNGSHAITKVTLGMSGAAHYSAELQRFSELNLVELNRGTESVLELELDRSRCGEEVDLRPEVPLVMRW